MLSAISNSPSETACASRLRYIFDVASSEIASASRLPSPNIFLNWFSAASWNELKYIKNSYYKICIHRVNYNILYQPKLTILHGDRYSYRTEFERIWESENITQMLPYVKGKNMKI